MSAVLLAGLVRGPLCGAMVLLVGGAIGFRLFAVPDGVFRTGAVISLIIFWVVSAPVLATANELRVQLDDAMARLSAALERRGKTA